MKIRKLIWDESHIPLGFPASAQTPFGNYTAWEINGVGYWLNPGKMFGGGECADGNLQAAYQKAQEHFEKLVGTCLEPDADDLRQIEYSNTYDW